MTTKRVWFHVIISTYGAWLPGDPRGFRTRHHREHVAGNYHHPPRSGLYSQRWVVNRQRLKHSPVVIGMDWRKLIGRALLERLQRLGGEVLAISCGGQHAHLLVQLDDGDARLQIGIVKRHTTYEAQAAGYVGRLWGTRGKIVRVRDESHRRNALRYILEHEHEGAWVWSTVKNPETEIEYKETQGSRSLGFRVPRMTVDETTEKLRSALREHWGYEDFRANQFAAITAVVEHRDSVVVLPTGGGKSLCYQVPAVVMNGLAVIVSPLISLMKDQVDTLTECGIPAAAVNSSLSPGERRQVADQIRSRQLKLLYVAPERLCTERMLDFLQGVEVSFFAIDEAHCISAWGHDFRPEYRLLGQLRERFPNVGVHAYTATATQSVREDIAAQLSHANPQFIVGSFDRPNLTYRVQRRKAVDQQIREVLDRHRDEAGIIYCLSRKEVDATAAELRASGYRVAAYHAGLTDEERHRNQDAFLNEEVEIVVATVAFGMGIDKPNVRFVVHTSAPKSLEHYQQETGRAGRDGLESECCLFYGPGDFMTWLRLQSELEGTALEQMQRNLRDMEQYCSGMGCRHAALVEYFGQPFERANCGACDVCLNQQDLMEDALTIGQKILSCVVRVNEGYGADYVAQVLTGSREQRLLDNGHHRLSTYGLLQNQPKAVVRDWIEQLAGQGFLAREGEYRTLRITPVGRGLLKGEGLPRLLAGTAPKAAEAKRASRSSMVGVDAKLFEHLRKVRRQLAEAKHVPPFIVFGDVTLQELAREQPSTMEEFRQIHGVGERKAAEYGAAFLQAIAEFASPAGASVP